MGYLRPPEKDIYIALLIEKDVPQHLQSLYLECMNNKPMSSRKTDTQLRDGCILSHLYLDIIHKENKL